MKTDILIKDNSITRIEAIADDSIHSIISDIPYGISYDDWDVLHNNSNSALGGTSSAQKKDGSVFKRRGKPLNGWSEADKKIPQEYQQWVEKWGHQWSRVLAPGGSVLIFAGRRFSHRAIVGLENSGLTFKDQITWQKNRAVHRAQHVSAIFKRRGDVEDEEKWESWRVANMRPLTEPILWFQKPYKTGTTLADNILKYGVGGWNEHALDKYTTLHDIPKESNMIRVVETSEDHKYHPTQKPLNLMKALIELVTLPGQIVLDPFAGSGTTLVAARDLKRHYIGYEINSKYYKTARERLEQPSQDFLL